MKGLANLTDKWMLFGFYLLLLLFLKSSELLMDLAEKLARNHH